jgi:hypothetical protein
MIPDRNASHLRVSVRDLMKRRAGAGTVRRRRGGAQETPVTTAA